MAVDVDKGSAGIAGVDRRISLNKRAGDGLITDFSVIGAYNACCYRLSVAERVADRNDVFTDLEVVGVSKRRDLDLVERSALDVGKGDRDHREVVAGVSSLDLRVAGLLVNKENSQMVCAIHNVIVGNDKEFRIGLADDNSGTGGFSLPCKGLSVESLNLLGKVVIYGYNGGHHCVHHFCELRFGSLRISNDQTRLVFDSGIRGRCCGLLLYGLFLLRGLVLLLRGSRLCLSRRIVLLLLSRCICIS